jgi:cytochrome P450
VSMAAIHTTSMASTAAIYDLAAHPKYIQPLRDEIQKVIDEDGQDVYGNGFMRLKKSSIPKLWKLDSFLKESQRFTPAQLGKSSPTQLLKPRLLKIISATNVRVTTAPLSLSTGHTLPTGTRFGIAAYAIQHSPHTPTFSPLHNPTSASPSEFDGFRFYNLRKIPGNENKHQYVTTGPDSLNFGHGNHACPGRFFASSEIKLVLIELLREWEFRFLEGKGRPENVVGDTNCTPDMRAVMEFRKRK